MSPLSPIWTTSVVCVWVCSKIQGLLLLSSYRYPFVRWFWSVKMSHHDSDYASTFNPEPGVILPTPDSRMKLNSGGRRSLWCIDAQLLPVPIDPSIYIYIYHECRHPSTTIPSTIGRSSSTTTAAAVTATTKDPHRIATGSAQARHQNHWFLRTPPRLCTLSRTRRLAGFGIVRLSYHYQKTHGFGDHQTQIGTTAVPIGGLLCGRCPPRLEQLFGLQYRRIGLLQSGQEL